MKRYSIPILITNDKYPYNCVDYQDGIKIKKEQDTNKIINLIEKHIEKVEEDIEVEIAFLGSSFEELEEEKQNELLELAYKFIQDGKATSIRVAIKPNEINKKVIKKYKQYKVKTIELETLSYNDYILNTLQVPYTYKEIKKAARKIRWNGFNLGIHMMVGLPESTRLDEINTAKSIVKIKPQMARISPIYVKKGTRLEEEYTKGEFSPLNVIQAIEVCKEIVRIFADENVDTIRLGFQDAERLHLLKEQDDIVSGPFHPEFYRLVEMAMWYDAILGKIKKLNMKVKEVEITVNPLDVENVIGIGNENILKLKDAYDVDLIVKSDESIKEGKSEIKITKTYNDFLET